MCILQNIPRELSNNTGSQKSSSAVSAIPKEFLCSINGHVMKDPVRAKSGEVFENETIKIWLVAFMKIVQIAQHTYKFIF